MIKSILGALLTLGFATTASAAVNCNTFPNNTVNAFVNDDVVAVGYTCTIGSMGSVNGGVTQTGDGGLVIRGRVNGGVSEDGPGDVLIARGAIVGGDVSEAGVGNMSVRGGASINGVIEESDDGSVNVTVDMPGLVKGDVYENGNGGVTINTLAGNFEGSVNETGPGNVNVTVSPGMSFKGEVNEHDGGNVTADVNGFFEGNIVEKLGGNVTTVSTLGTGVFKGNSEHQAPGTCTNAIVNFQGSACILI
jgi:hypothetical protein